MALIANDSVKFKANGKIYTLQLTDNVDMICSIMIEGQRYYVATKEETIKSLSSKQSYREEVEIFYKAGDTVISLGIQENIYTPDIKNTTIIYISTERDNFIYDGIHMFEDCTTVNPKDSDTNSKVMLCDNTINWNINNVQYIEDGDSRFAVTSTIRANEYKIIQCGTSDNFIMSNVMIPLHGEQRFMVYAKETEIIH